MNGRQACAVGGAVLALGVPVAFAEVYQCVDADGRVLLTDAGCPSGYRENLVVATPPMRPEDQLAYQEELEARAAAADAQREAAQAEVRRLRAQLAAEQAYDDDQQARIEALDRRLDSVLDAPQVYPGTAAVVPLPVLPWCGATGRPGFDCRPRVTPRPQPERRPPVPGVAERVRPHPPPHDRAAPHERRAPKAAAPPGAPPPPRAQVRTPDPRESCGTFGCTPGITHAPWDDRAGGRDRTQRH